MKKIICATVALIALSACADISKYTTVAENATTKEKMRFIVYPPEEVSKWNLFDIDKYLSVNRVD